MKEKDIRNPEIHQRYLEMVAEDAAVYFFHENSLENTPCPACMSADFQKQFVKFGFTYGTCKNCRTLYANPRPKPDALKDFYVKSPSSRYWVEHFFKPVMQARREKIFRPRAAYISHQFPEVAGGPIGDIGAGFGLFLSELRTFFPKARMVAIEPSPEMAAICREEALDVQESTIEEISDCDETFSLITSFELLEHLHNPKSMVSKAFQLLKSGGYFVITTLSGEGFDIQLLWENSRSVFPPHHLNFLNLASLAQLCRDAGFTILSAESPGLLDWQIVEGAIERGEARLERFWEFLAKYGGKECKEDFQTWITRHGLSSHMRIIAKKP